MDPDEEGCFLGIMGTYISREGVKSPFVPFPEGDPSYGDMTGPQSAYYLYWRDCLRIGVPLRSDTGYRRLALAEVKNGRRPDDETARVLKALQTLMEGEDDRDGFMYITARLVCLGQPLTVIRYEDDYSCDLAVCDAFSRLPQPLPPDVIDVITGKDAGTGHYSDEVRRVFSRTLSHFIDSIGKGRFLSVFGGGRQCIEAEWGRNIRPYDRAPDVFRAIEYDQILLERPLVSLCNEIMRCCTTLRRDRPGDHGSIHSNVVRLVSEDMDRMPEGRYASIRIVDVRDVDVPVCFRKRTVGCTVRTSWERTLSTTDGSGYIPSVFFGRSDPNIRLSPYYGQWSESLREGRCMTTDRGYMQTLVADAVDRMDPEDAIDILSRAAAGYGTAAPWLDDIIGGYMADHNVRPKVLTRDMHHLRMCMALDGICRNGNVIATPAGIRTAFDPDWRDALAIDDAAAGLICRRLHREFMAGDRRMFYRKLGLRGIHLGHGGGGRTGGSMHINDWAVPMAEEFLRRLAHGVLAATDGPPLEETLYRSVGRERDPVPGDGGRMWRELFRRPRGMVPDYVPGPWSEVDRRTMTSAQIDYYRYWRGGILEGRFPKGDAGYVRLLLSDILTSDMEWEDVSPTLDRLRSDYPRMMDTIDRFSCDWCLVHGRSMDCIPDWELSRASMRDVLSHPIGKIPERTLKHILRLVEVGQVSDTSRFGDDLRKADDALHFLTGKGVADMFFADGKVIDHMAFSDYGEAGCIHVEVRSPSHDEGLYRFIGWVASGFTGALRSVPDVPLRIRSYINTPRSAWESPEKAVRRGRVSVTKGYARKRGKDVPEEAVSPPEGGDIVLDMEAVRSAQMDLDSVTELMATGVTDEGLPETCGSVREPVSEGDPWKVFASSLGQDEVEYLVSLLMRTDRADVRMEDSINAKAMDAVGDTVVEGGRIVEDYRGYISPLRVEGSSPHDGPEVPDGDGSAGSDDAFTAFLRSLGDDELRYVMVLAQGIRPPGRRPVKRIESINAKAEATMGHPVISDGELASDITEAICELMERNRFRRPFLGIKR